MLGTPCTGKKIVRKFRENFVFPKILKNKSQNGRIIAHFEKKMGKFQGKIQNFPKIFPWFFSVCIWAMFLSDCEPNCTTYFLHTLCQKRNGFLKNEYFVLKTQKILLLCHDTLIVYMCVCWNNIFHVFYLVWLCFVSIKLT